MRRVLLVGAGGGLGQAAARLMLARGWEVTATVSQPGKVASFERAMPGCRQVLALDLADAEAVRDTLRALVVPLDAVLVCAAVSPPAPLETTSLAEARRIWEINCLSNLAIYQALVPALRRSRGRLVLTSSLSGRVATPMVGAYVASKFALEGLADTMRQEAEPWGVDVVLLEPGGIDTGMVDAVIDRLRADIASLAGEAAALYADLYHQFLHRVASAREQRTGLPPETVARVAVAAIGAERPETRYPIGADAEYILGAARTLPDREIDRIILEAYRSAPPRASSAKDSATGAKAAT